MIDTVYVGGYESDLYLQVSKLCEEIDSKASFHKGSNKFLNDRLKTKPGYYICKSWHFEGKMITLQSSPNFKKAYLPDFSITIHLCQFNSFNEFVSWFRFLTGPFFIYLFFKASLYRLDLCFFTTDFKLRSLFLGMRRVNARSVKLFGEFHNDKNTGRTMLFNRKGSIVYETTCPSHHIVALKKGNDLLEQKVIKFEERYRKKSEVPADTLSQLVNLTSFEPFTMPSGNRKYRFYTWTTQKRNSLKSTPKLKLKTFTKKVRKIGFQKAFKVDGRSLYRYLKQIEVEVNLNSYFKKSLRKFMNS
jgi:hypothetical protein